MLMLSCCAESPVPPLLLLRLVLQFLGGLAKKYSVKAMTHNKPMLHTMQCDHPMIAVLCPFAPSPALSAGIYCSFLGV
jgi:hypothetical protein